MSVLVRGHRELQTGLSLNIFVFDTTMLFHALHWREIGLDSPLVLREEVIKHRVVGLELSRTKEIQDVGGAVNCLSIDLCEARYLLSGRADGAIVLHDVEDASANQTARLTCPSVLTIGKKHGHAFSVSAIEWCASLVSAKPRFPAGLSCVFSGIRSTPGSSSRWASTST